MRWNNITVFNRILWLQHNISHLYTYTKHITEAERGGEYSWAGLGMGGRGPGCCNIGLPTTHNCWHLNKKVVTKQYWILRWQFKNFFLFCPMHNKFESGKMYIYTCINNIKHSFPDFMYYFLILNLSALRIWAFSYRIRTFLTGSRVPTRIQTFRPDPDLLTRSSWLYWGLHNRIRTILVGSGLFWQDPNYRIRTHLKDFDRQVFSLQKLTGTGFRPV